MAGYWSINAIVETLHRNRFRFADFWRFFFAPDFPRFNRRNPKGFGKIAAAEKIYMKGLLSNPFYRVIFANASRMPL
jgi:hypothetical protein